MSQPVYMFDNTTIKIQIAENISAATDVKINYVKPDGTHGEWEADKDGQYIVYKCENNELNQPGLWQFQAVYDLSGRKTSAITTLMVSKPLDA